MKPQKPRAVKGHLEIMDSGAGFLRSIENNFNSGPHDILVPADLINDLGLREGSYIVGTGIWDEAETGTERLHRIQKIDGLSLKIYQNINPLSNRTSINPSKRFILTRGSEDLMGKVLDLLTPIGMGQRGLVVSPPKSGKTTILRHMANSIVTNHPEVEVFILLIDERPEEVTDFKRGLKKARVLFSSADKSVYSHMRMTRIAMHTAIRCAESGKDAVVFIDSLTRMSRAFNSETENHGRTLSGGLGANALEIPRKIFGAARNLEEGGSLTIIASILVDTGSRMDDVIFHEFKGTGNMELVLSRKCAEQRVYPAVNINHSGTRKEDYLLDAASLKRAFEIRRFLAPLDEVTAMSKLLTYLSANESGQGSV